MSLLIAFTMQIASNALFYHTHNIQGKTYAHSHPGCKHQHSHSTFEFAFYEQLQNITSEEIPQLLADQLPIYLQARTNDLINQYVFDLHLSQPGRGPPVF
ncbi:MAG: hypothetical protein N4A74_19405 [Carboxylicivirga sp.]|jgi:hypothetical protein|nr:hypothetical protein [Carboxylicivirga sp.]